MEKIDLTKCIRLPKFLSTEEYAVKLSKFFAEGNYTIGKQEIPIYGCDSVMLIYSDLIRTIPESKVKPLALHKELDFQNAFGFVFAWLYINGAIQDMMIDNDIMLYKFDIFMSDNYGIDELLEIVEWFNYFSVSTNIDNHIVNVINTKFNPYDPCMILPMEKSKFRLIASNMEKRYWSNPWKYNNYGIFAISIHTTLRSEHITSTYKLWLDVKVLTESIDNGSYPTDNISVKLAEQFVNFISMSEICIKNKQTIDKLKLKISSSKL